MTSTIRPVAGSTAWRTRAACRGADPEAFYASGRAFDAGAAVAICRTCPVIDDCLRAALDADEQMGIWGGRTPQERRALVAAPRVRYPLLPVDPDGTGGRPRFRTWATTPDFTDLPR